MTVDINGTILDHNSWNPENMTTKKCKHCKEFLCNAEVQINKNGWHIRHHYDCFNCFQRYHA